MASGTLLLSVDLEDWHQLARRRLGLGDEGHPERALERQVEEALVLFDALGVRATFFVLGLVAHERPGLVASVADRGHEIACHGYAHLPVYSQTPEEFASDLRGAREAIAQACGQLPVGYRAPAFSITGEAADWAYAVLAREGFAYDSSQHDSPRIRGRLVDPERGPHAIALGDERRLWELPVAVWRPRGIPVPVGGASYWSLAPRALVLRGLGEAPAGAGLYLHPQELGSERLHLALPAGSGLRLRARAALRTLQRESARRRARGMLEAIAHRFELIPYGELHATLDERARAGTRPLQR